MGGTLKKTTKPNRRQRRRAAPAVMAPTTADLVQQGKLWPVAEAAYQIGIHRVTLYRLANAGEIRLVKVGRRTYVTDAELDRFVARAEVNSA
jgi:excisionase family DNA binding protein